MASPRLQSSWVWNKNPETNHWKSYQQEAISALGVQASISDDGLTAFSEVHILPVHGGLPLLLPAHHVGIASNLPLRLALVRDHIPADDKEEKCPKGLKRGESYPGRLKKILPGRNSRRRANTQGPETPCRIPVAWARSWFVPRLLAASTPCLDLLSGRRRWAVWRSRKVHQSGKGRRRPQTCEIP